MLLLLFTNIFIHIQQPSFPSRNPEEIYLFTFNSVFLIHDYIGPIYTGDGSSVQTDHPSRRIIRLV